jgi:hypothetical protein
VAVDADIDVVVDGFVGRELQPEGDELFLVGGILKSILAAKLHGVGAVPEQTLLAMVEVESDIDVAAVRGETVVRLVFVGFGDRPAVLFFVEGLRLNGGENSRGRDLFLFGAPSGSDLGVKLLVGRWWIRGSSRQR